MPDCTINLAWYLGKFVIGFTGILFLYVSFLKEKEKSCICDTTTRELLREKSEKMQSKRYLCGCNQPKRLIRNDGMEPMISNDCTKNEKYNSKSRCCIRRNSC